MNRRSSSRHGLEPIGSKSNLNASQGSLLRTTLESPGKIGSINYLPTTSGEAANSISLSLQKSLAALNEAEDILFNTNSSLRTAVKKGILPPATIAEKQESVDNNKDFFLGLVAEQRISTASQESGIKSSNEATNNIKKKPVLPPVQPAKIYTDPFKLMRVNSGTNIEHPPSNEQAIDDPSQEKQDIVSRLTNPEFYPTTQKIKLEASKERREQFSKSNGSLNNLSLSKQDLSSSGNLAMAKLSVNGSYGSLARMPTEKMPSVYERLLNDPKVKAQKEPQEKFEGYPTGFRAPTEEEKRKVRKSKNYIELDIFKQSTDSIAIEPAPEPVPKVRKEMTGLVEDLPPPVILPAPKNEDWPNRKVPIYEKPK